MSTMVYIAIGLLVLILMALLIGKSYNNSQQANKGCGLVEPADCLASCPDGKLSLGYCADKEKVCCKT